ncbi:hypothetical protein OF385_12085 [Glutamicibacter sp. JL.03c]|uniref:hypothetical protein n=1 Tax=Glutamicibacter sp. JL.03c TaxID=2984842 RepID=UPI0021F6A78C|nr:hypothetical protein [Glutamicibacter sp. JL.03c]UYQ76757.1 hypothetical protein OF385_12085 [Glutamicibacter sp. JL.03c]
MTTRNFQSQVNRRPALPKKRSFNELSRGTQAAVVVFGILELTLMIAALRDLSKRPGALVRGPKPLWAVISCLNILGSISYFTVGRRKQVSRRFRAKKTTHPRQYESGLFAMSVAC